jgi:hypothetical protein
MWTSTGESLSFEIRLKIYDCVGAEALVLRCVNKFFALELGEYTIIHTWSCTPSILRLYMAPSVNGGNGFKARCNQQRILYCLVTGGGSHDTLMDLLYGVWYSPGTLTSLNQLCTAFYLASASDRLDLKRILHHAIGVLSDPTLPFWCHTSYEKVHRGRKAIQRVVQCMLRHEREITLGRRHNS